MHGLMNTVVRSVADRDIRAGDEVLSTRSSYWVSPRMRVFKVLYDFLSAQYAIDPTRTWTAAEPLVDLYSQPQIVRGKDKRIGRWKKWVMRYDSRTIQEFFGAPPTMIKQTPAQDKKYLKVQELLGTFARRNPKRRRNHINFDYPIWHYRPHLIRKNHAKDESSEPNHFSLLLIYRLLLRKNNYELIYLEGL